MGAPHLFGRLILVCGALACSTARAETYAMLLAISFATSGIDSAEVTAIDRKNCVFSVKTKERTWREIFHFNDIYVDRLNIRKTVPRTIFDRQQVLVDLHGDGLIVEQVGGATQEAPVNLTDETLSLPTAEGERVVSAWNYIYQKGCTGKSTPFAPSSTVAQSNSGEGILSDCRELVRNLRVEGTMVYFDQTAGANRCWGFMMATQELTVANIF